MDESTISPALQLLDASRELPGNPNIILIGACDCIHALPDNQAYGTLEIFLGPKPSRVLLPKEPAIPEDWAEFANR
jgi:hypothetical protein